MKGVVGELAFQLYPVGLGLLVARVGNAVNQGTIIAEQQQAFGVVIQPTCSVDPGHADHVGQGGAAFPVGKLGKHSVGLVQ